MENSAPGNPGEQDETSLYEQIKDQIEIEEGGDLECNKLQ